MGKLILNFFAFYHYDMASSSALLPPKRPQMTAKLDSLKINYVMGLNRDALLADWTMHGVIQGDSHIKGAGKGLFAVRGNPLSKTNSFLKKTVCGFKHWCLLCTIRSTRGPSYSFPRNYLD